MERNGAEIPQSADYMAMDSYPEGVKSTTLKKQPQHSNKSYEPGRGFDQISNQSGGSFVVVETVNESNDEENDIGKKMSLNPLVVEQRSEQEGRPCHETTTKSVYDNSQHSKPDTQFVLVCMPQTQEEAIQFGMTLLFTLIVAAGFLSFLAARNYRFVVAIVWLLLISLFSLFAFFVQEGVLGSEKGTGRARRVFHPVIHAAADMLVAELENFRKDWNEQILLLTNGEERQEEDVVSDDDLDNLNHGELSHQEHVMPVKKGRWKNRFRGKSHKFRSSGSSEQQPPRSRVFLVLVKPLLPILRQQRRTQKDNMEAVCRDDVEIV